MEKGRGDLLALHANGFLMVPPARARRVWRKESCGWEGGEGGLWCSPPKRRSKRWEKVRDEDG